MGKDEKCGCPCHKMFAILTVLFGLTFLLGSMDILSAHIVSMAWPIIVMVAGLSKLASSKCNCCGHS